MVLPSVLIFYYIIYKNRDACHRRDFPAAPQKEQGTSFHMLCSFRHCFNRFFFRQISALFFYRKTVLSVAVVLAVISAGIPVTILAVVSAGISAGILTVVSAGIFAGILAVVSAGIFTGILAVISAGISAVFHILVIIFHGFTS